MTTSLSKLPRVAEGPRAILHLLNGEQYSGLERVVDHLADGASAYGLRLVLGLLKPSSMRRRPFSSSADVHDLSMRSRFDLGVSARAARLARECGCSLIQSHTVRSALVAQRVQLETGLPWLHQVHSPALHESERSGLNLVNFLAEAVVMRRADLVITVSQALAAYVTKYYRVSPDRVAVVPNGVVTNPSSCVTTFLPAGHQRPFVILTLGLFRPRKGIDRLVEASAILVAAGHDVRLRIAGEFADAAYARRINALITRLGLDNRIERLGFIQDVATALDGCDLFALPSLYGEGMPMAVLEAMSRGRAIVASDIDGIRELLDAGAGALAPPDSARALAQAIAPLIIDPKLRERLGMAALARQQQHYSIESMQSRMFAAYGQLMGRAA